MIQLGIDSRLVCSSHSVSRQGMAKRGAEIGDVFQLSTANSGASETMQGPFPPWCVGSTFSPPQLVTSDLCRLIFNQVGQPECIISTGHQVEFQESVALKTSEQTKSFLLSTSAPFVPSRLLQDHLEEDAALQKAESHEKRLDRGNRLASLKFSDGNIILFFPCGKIGEKIGSTLCYPRVDGAWYPVRKSSTAADDDLDGVHWSVSPSFSQPILQLYAVMLQSDVVDGHVYVAARTSYQVHFCIVLREMERIRFVSTYTATFQTRVSHVTWNPHLDREAAVLLENGEVSLFDVPMWRSGPKNRVMDLDAKLTLENPAQSLWATSRRRDPISALAIDIFTAGCEQDSPKDNLDTVESVDVSWWRCEFSWHPQILLVSGLRTVVQMDYREKYLSESSIEGSRCMKKKISCEVSIVAEVGFVSAVSRFCYMKSKEEHIFAFARAEYDGMCNFSVATEKHLMLFDARRAGAPVLQWEHGMSAEPPDLLIMLQASALQNTVDGGKLRNHQNGRVIVAVSFQSGDIRLFFYGSKRSRESSMRKKYSTTKDFESCDWDDLTFAWEMPVKLYPPKAVANDWDSLLTLSDVQLPKKVHRSREPKGPDCISGIILLSDYSPKRSMSNSRRAFTMLQLTGSGDILLQQYKASDQSTIVPNVRPASVSRAEDKKEGWEAEKLRLLVLGAFFKCIHMRTGCTLPVSYADQGNLSYRAEGGARVDNVNSLNEEGMGDLTQVIKPSGLEKEKDMADSHFRSQLKTVLQHLSVPVSMYEVAHTVLRMGIPPTWLPSAAGLPSDLGSARYRGYKLRSFLPLIDSGPPENSDQILVGNLSRPIPLPSLLEVQHWSKWESSSSTKSHCNNGDFKVRGNSVAGGGEEVEQAECIAADPEQFGFGKRIVPGQKLLLEACSHVENAFTEFEEKQVRSVISLSGPSEDWRESDLDSRILVHEISMDIFSKPDNVNKSTLVEKVQNSINAESDEDFGEELGKSFSQGRLCKFVAGKPLRSQGKDKRDRFTNMDAETCPVKLSYTRAEEGPLEEQLEEQEWSALESFHAQLRDWLQSFTPYRQLYG